MRKKFTMLLAALFLVMGTAWAQMPEVGKEYRIRDDKSEKYLTIRSYNGNSSGAYGTVPLLEKAQVNADQVWVLETAENNTYYLKSKSGYYLKCRGWNVDALNGGDKSAVSLEAPTVDYLNGLTLPAYNEGASFCIKNGNLYFKSQGVNQDGGIWHPFCNAKKDDGWADRTTWTFEEVPVDEFKEKVSLTVVYKYGERILGEETVEEYPDANYTFVSSYAYARVASCAIGDAATEGATIVVPDANATVTVELANNFPFEVSADYENATWYVLQIRSNNKKYVVRSESAPYANTTTTPTTEDALWAFVGNPFDGIQVLNKAAGTGKTLALDANNNAVMTEGTTTWNITKGNGGFLLRNGNEGINYLHDYNSTLKIWADNSAATDQGSAFVVTSEAEMISLATTAMGFASKLDTYAEASYYTYPNAAVAEAKATLQSVATPTDFLTALQAKATVESVQAALNTAGKSGAPAAGHVIQLKNKSYGKYLKANDADLTHVADKNDLTTLWVVEAGDEGNVKLKNYSTNKYIGEIRESARVAMVEEASAKQFSWTNQTDIYAVFKETTGGGRAYGHINGSGVLVGWEPGADASQWAVCNVCPLSITYFYNSQELGTSTIIAEKNAVYTVSSPYDFTAPSAVTVGEEPLVAVDGVFSFEVTGATTLTVELAEDLPFVKTTLEQDGSFPENTAWYVVKQHSTLGYTQTWKYDAESGVTTESTTTYTDNHLWCFAGSKDNLKIYNKVAGSSVSLTNTDIASMAAENAAVWKMVKSAAEASFAGKNPFCLQKGDATSYLNTQDGVLKYWGSKDQGSTIMVIAHQPLSIKYMFKGEELTDLSVNKLVESGSTYTVTNPYANKYVNVTCAVNGNRVEPVDGQWTVNVTEPTSVIVTITEDLPFKISKDFATANWQYLQMNSSAWKYMQKNENDNNTSSVGVGSLSDRALWAFVGDALNGFQIWNKAHEGAVLTVDAVTDGTAAYMKASGDQKWTIEKGNGGFIIRQGAKECLNDHAGGGVMKIWNADASPTGAGSAFRTISASVTDLADLCFPGVFTLQAERSPLLYDANAERPNKLSSGMASGIAANGNDANQQFLISESETDGLYYLYSVGAAKFVDAELNFTDYPQPVLSFESNAGNPVFPWFVKIGGKYVAPGSGGTEGNKIHHLASVNNDDGKRYRIEKVGEDMSLAQNVALTIQYEEGLIKEASQLDNGKVYAVFTFDRGAWYHNGDDALWSTGKTAKPGDAAENADHFAFLTVNEKIYLYSVGADKFIVKSETAGSTAHTDMYYATYSDIPTQTVELLPATNGGWFPVVVKLNVEGPNQLNVSNNFSYPIIMWNDQADLGNQVRIEEIGTLDLSAVVAKIEAYQLDEEAKGGLQTLITEATTKNAYLENASLTDAITAAQAALDKVGATYDELMTAKTSLATALNSALYVTEANGFSNDYVYTFVTLRGWVGADENSDNLIGTVNSKVNPAPTPSDDNTMFQWAVYKSTREHYYMYNIGKGKFMGMPNGETIPFADTPQGLDLTFKRHNNDNAKWADYPIMFSPDNKGAVSQNQTAGLFYWSDGWNTTNDDGSNHKVTVVGKIDEETLSTIAAAVELYETQGVAVQALDAAIAAAQAKVDGIGNGLGYYSSTNANVATDLAAIVDFKNAITAETAVDAIEDQTAAANALVETFSVNLPEAGKFYRIKNNGETGYLSGDHATSGRTHFVAGIENSASSIFYFDGTKLLSYKTGTYLAAKIPSGKNANFLCYTEELNVGTDITFKESPALGKLLIVFDNKSRSFYSANTGESDAAPAGNNGENYRFIVEEVISLPVTITNAQVTFDGNDKCVSTLFTPVALEVPTGITAYIGVNEDNYLAMEAIVGVGEAAAIIPAGTGVILMADAANTYNFTISTEAGTAIGAEDNIITGTVAKAIITPENENATCYILANDTEDGVGLYKAKLNKNTSGADVTENATSFLNNACKAYIRVPVAEPQAVKALTMRLGRGSQGGTTSIESSELNAQGVQLIYDLQGRRVLNPTKGMYIVNGKKMVIK